MKAVPSSNAMLKVVAIDEGADFFFTILQANQKEEGKTTYSVSIKPYSNLHMDQHDTEITPDQIEKALSKWVLLLKQYAKKSPLFDDPILQKYFEDLGIYFNIIDPDAATKPYGLTEQRYLLEFFENIKIVVLGSKNAQAKENETCVSEIIKHFTEAGDKIGRETQLQVVDRFKWGMAKLIKHNAPLGQVLLEQINRPEAQKMITGGPKVPLPSGETP